MKIVPAQQWMVEGFKIPASSRAYACMDGDRVDGIAGYYHDRGRIGFFALGGEEARKHPVTLARAVRRMVAEAKATGLPLHAEADPEIPGSARFLEFLGFHPLPNGVFVCRQPTS